MAEVTVTKNTEAEALDLKGQPPMGLGTGDISDVQTLKVSKRQELPINRLKVDIRCGTDGSLLVNPRKNRYQKLKLRKVKRSREC